MEFLKKVANHIKASNLPNKIVQDFIIVLLVVELHSVQIVLTLKHLNVGKLMTLELYQVKKI